MPAPLVADPLGQSLSAMPARWLAAKTWVMQKGPGRYQAFVLGSVDAIVTDKETAKAVCVAALWQRTIDIGDAPLEYWWERHSQDGDGLDLWTMEVDG